MPGRAAVEVVNGEMWRGDNPSTMRQLFGSVSVAVCALSYVASFEWRSLGEFLSGCHVDQGSLWLAVIGKARKQALGIRPGPSCAASYLSAI